MTKWWVERLFEPPGADAHWVMANSHKTQSFMKNSGQQKSLDKALVLYSSSLVLQVTTPTHLSLISKTLIDNIFTTDWQYWRHYLWKHTTISDHLVQFILYPIEQLKHDNKMDLYKQSFKNFKPQDFQRNLENINWDRALKIDKNQTIWQILQCIWNSIRYICPFQEAH